MKETRKIPVQWTLITRRRFLTAATASVGTLAVAACGGASETTAAPVASPPAPAPAPPPAPTPAPTPAPAAAADWKTRISGPGVVWYHNFDSAAELNQFRWTSGWGSGNDPQNLGGGTGLTWQATGGPDNGPHIRLYHAAAGPSYVGDPGTKSKWVRPFSPLTGASNGRGQDDPAANNTLVPQVWSPTSGGDQTVLYDARQRSGYYGKAGYEAAGNYFNASLPQQAKIFDGNDFYVQLRIKADPDRMAAGSVRNGKNFAFTSMTMVTYSNQELVTVSAYPTPTGAPNQPNVHQMYDGSYGYIADIDAGPTANPGGANWAYSGGWDTLLYHVTPGTANVSGDEGVPGGGAGSIVRDTRLEVWAAHEGETSYTKIWDTYYRAIFENTFNDGFGRGLGAKYGWNAFSFFNYQNVDTPDGVITNDFNQSIGQVIFSKSMIPCPQA